MTLAPARSAPVPRPACRISLRLDLPCGARIGPGKVVLLEAIANTGSISAAGRALKMSYRRAWELVEDLNRHLGTAVVATAAGGSGGGGARLTATGQAVSIPIVPSRPPASPRGSPISTPCCGLLEGNRHARRP